MRPKKTKSASKPTNPMNLLRGAVGQKSSHHLQVALEAYKCAGPISNFALAYVLASANPNFSSVYAAGRKVVNQAALGLSTPLNVASLSREIQWAAVSIYSNRDLLNTFVTCRQEFFVAFVSGNFARANEHLDAITTQCGESSWAIENRIALLTVEGGFEKQKKFVQQLTRERGRSNVSFVATQFGERNEPRVSAASFQHQFKTRSKGWGVDEQTLAFLSYKLTNRIDSTEMCYAAILANEGSWSVIDLYESFLDVIRRSRREHFHDIETSVAALDFIDVADWRIQRLRSYLQDEAPANDRQLESASEQLFNRGQFSEALAAAHLEVTADPCNFSAVATFAKASNEVEGPIDDLTGWLPFALKKALRTLYSMDSATGQAADDLVKLSMNLRHSDFALEIILPIAQFSSRGVGDRRALMREGTLYRPSAPNILEKTVREDLADCPQHNEANVFRLMVSNIEDGNWGTALGYARELENAAASFYRTCSSYLSSHLLDRLLRPEEALEKSVSICIDNPSSIIFTPLVKIVRPRGFRDLKSMAENAALASAFFIYAQHTGRTDKEVALKVAWKKYLASRDIDRPSLLLKPKVSFGKLDAFFLSCVCTQETMELGGAFSSQMDLDRERMQICIGLAQIDAANISDYDQEIVDLTRRINIEEAVQYLESSRVFVDEIGILSWAKKNLESQFLRYIDYLKAGMFSSAREIESRLLKIATTSKNRKAAIENYLDDYDVSAESLLEEIVVRLAKAFLSKPRYGLDAFLSSRVRHGSFVGYLRGPLELKHLVTKKNSSTGKYLENSYILDRWGTTGIKERNSINSTLSVFSAHIDSLLDDAVSNFLHVRSRSKPAGMVAFTTESGSEGYFIGRWLLLLKSTLDEHSTLDELVRHCFHNLFWPSVKVSLDRLQMYVKNELGNDLTFAIDKLADDVRPHLHEANRGALLQDRFYVKREIKAAVDLVARWFDAPKNNAQLLTMSFPRAIEIGLESTKNARPNFHPKVSWEIAEDAAIEINGQAIGVVNDIAFLIFANVAKHSGFEETDYHGKSEPSISVNIQLAGENIELYVESEICPKKDLSEIREGIASAKSKIQNKEFDSVIQNTQGTGLVRLAIASGLNDGRENEAVKFGLSDKSKFFVRILIARGVIEPLREGEVTA